MSEPHDMPYEPRQLPEAEAKKILDRAMELDHFRGPMMTMENLRTIARELGISDDSLRGALDESMRATQRRSQSRTQPVTDESAREEVHSVSKWFGWSRESWSKGLRFLTRATLPLGLISGAFTLVWARLLGFDPELGFTILSLIALMWAGLIAIRPRKSTTVQNIALTVLYWVGFFAGAVAVNPEPHDFSEMMRITVMLCTGAIAVGIVVTAATGLVRFLTPGGTSSSGSAGDDFRESDEGRSGISRRDIAPQSQRT